ncbi:MAG: STAS domain-containing protein, partial [Bacteroidales bacterium]|nr:STAS domain-containing protein [Bacteroidales bacterium]
TENDGKTLVAVQGDIDTNTCPKLQSGISPLMEREGLDLELDLGRTEYISSKALRIIISLQQAILANKGKMRITSVSPAVREIFDMTGLTKSFLHLDQKD